jgi:hypothetical protein
MQAGGSAMKRKSSLIIMSLLALLVALPVLAQAAPVGKFTSVEGNVDVTIPGKPAVKAILGDPLNVGDIIRTKSKSKCEVAFVDGSILRLAKSSRLRVTEFAREKEGRIATLNLFRGKIQNIVNTIPGAESAGSKFEIYTPTAVIGIRGTNFFCFFLKGVSGAVFKEGEGYGYSLNRPDEVKTIKAGQAMLVTSPDIPPVIRPATELEIKQNEKDTAPPEKPKEEGEKEKEGRSETAWATAEEGKGDEQDQRSASTSDTKEGTGDTPADTTAGIGEAAAYASVEESASAGGAIAEQVEMITSNAETETQQTPPSPYVSPEPEPAPEPEPEPRPEPEPGPGPFPLPSTATTSVSGNIISAAGTAGATPSINTVSGTMDDGSGFAGYLTGVSGSWEGLMSSIYVTGSGAGYLYGSLSGTYDVGTGEFSGSGPATRTGILGSTAIAPGSLVGSLEQMGYISNDLEPTTVGYPLPIMGSIGAGGAISPYACVVDGELRGITTTSGKRLGVWGVTTIGGEYSNGLPSWDCLYGQADSYRDYYMLGNVAGTDDMLGHVKVAGNLTYMDTGYLGEIGLNYRGKYDEYGSYQSAGAGTYILDPLAWSGYWGGGSLYYNNGGNITWAGDENGLIGGLTAPWSGPASFTAMGEYDLEYSGYPHYLWSTPVGSGELTVVDGYFNGRTAGIWKAPEAAANYGVMMAGGAMRAIYYKDGTAGILSSDDIFGYHYPVVVNTDCGMWMAGGAMTPTPMANDINVGSLGNGGGYFFGSFAGSFDDTAGSMIVSKEINGENYHFTVDGQRLPWGIYNLELVGCDYVPFYTGKPSGDSAWSARIGGGFYFNSENYEEAGYWLASVSGNWSDAGEITGSLVGRYLTPTELGTIGGPFYGISSDSDGTWIGQSIGTYVGRLLQFVSEVDTRIYHWNGTYLIYTDCMDGLMGGADSLWSGSDVKLLGNYSNDPDTGLGTSLDNGIWHSEVHSHNYKTGYNTTYGDLPGAYQGYIGGAVENNVIDGNIYAIYIGPSDTSAYPAGILVGGFTGTAYPDIEMWEGQGGIHPVVYLMDVSTSPYNLAANIYQNDFWGDSSSSLLFSLNNVILINYVYEGEYSFFKPTASAIAWGSWQSAMGGSYSGISMNNTWSASVEYSYSGDTRTGGQELTGTLWSGNTIKGTTVGYGADTDIAATWVSVGDVLGTFDPTTFQIGSVGVGIETNTFLALAATEGGRAKLQALNIPAVQVGMTTLSQGVGEVNGLSGVTMSNVSFFATSTGGAPSIWATGAVSGNYNSMTEAWANPVPLAGGGLTASFGITNWDYSGGVWGAKVNGGGTLSGGSYNGNINFRGGAAGTINTDGFSGTAAGVAKPAP